MFRNGVLLNSGDAVERLADADRVVFDKTGTLTLPELDVTNAADIPTIVRACRAACACQPSSRRRRCRPGRQGKDAVVHRRRGAGQGVRGLSKETKSGWAGRRFAMRIKSPTRFWRGIPKHPSSPSVDGEVLRVCGPPTLRPDAAAVIAGLEGRD